VEGGPRRRTVDDSTHTKGLAARHVLPEQEERRIGPTHPSLTSPTRLRATNIPELRHERLLRSAGSGSAELCLVGGMPRLRPADLETGFDRRLQQAEGWPGDGVSISARHICGLVRI